MIQGLYGVDVFHNFALTTQDQTIINSADDILSKLDVGTKLLIKKRDFIVNLMVNFKTSSALQSYLAIPRGNDYYRLLPKRNAIEYQTAAIVTKVLDELKDKRYISSRGYIAKVQMSGYYTTKIFQAEIDKVKPENVILLRPESFVVLRKKYENENIDVDYKPTNFTRNLEKDLNVYNDLREKSKITINSVDDLTYYVEDNFLLKHSSQDLSSYPLTSLMTIQVRSGYSSRIFNGSFKREGRFYQGVETNMPKIFRKKIHINGNPTVELDFSAHHIRILYHLRKINITTDPYDIEPTNPSMRGIYKSVFLRCINTKSRKSALQSLYKYFDENPNELAFLPDNSNETRNALIDKLMECNPSIKDDFFKQKCFTLMNKDSNIAHNILMHFAGKNILVLCVHDSFIIDQQYKKELEDKMIEEYKKIFKFDPVIK